MDKEVIGKYEACSLSGGPDSNRSDETLGVLFFFGKIGGAPLCYLSRGNLGCSWGHSTWQDLISFVGFTC